VIGDCIALIIGKILHHDVQQVQDLSRAFADFTEALVQQLVLILQLIPAIPDGLDLRNQFGGLCPPRHPPLRPLFLPNRVPLRTFGGTFSFPNRTSRSVLRFNSRDQFFHLKKTDSTILVI
jgi:hypothetical protein